MARVVFAAPFAMAATLRFMESVAALPGVRMGLLTQEGPERLPASLRARLAAHGRIDDLLDPATLADGVRALGRQLSGVDRLIGTLEQLQVPLAQVREGLGIPGMGVKAAERFRDKALMKETLRAGGVPCARHALATSLGEAEVFASEVGFPLVLKPPAGAGAKATLRVENGPELTRTMKEFQPGPGREVLVEEFVRGEEHSFDTVSLQGRAVWHSLSHYEPSPLEVLENPWIQWCVIVPREVNDPRYDDIRKVAVRTLDLLGMDSGVTHMEWFRRPDGSLAVSEVAARPPGAQFCSLISYANDFDFYRAWAQAVVYETFDPPKRRFAAGAAYLRGQGRGRVKAIHGLDTLQKEMGGLVVEAHLPSGGQPPSDSYEGDGYVILRHPETSVVARALRRLVSVARIELA